MITFYIQFKTYISYLSVFKLHNASSVYPVLSSCSVPLVIGFQTPGQAAQSVRSHWYLTAHSASEGRGKERRVYHCWRILFFSATLWSEFSPSEPCLPASGPAVLRPPWAGTRLLSPCPATACFCSLQSVTF